uniref:Uncharacterized protein n=1 Tax=Fibrocapsa japonica TaxID=94617 RepID=A0A7S2UYS6_9STRA|mmetsp:Transcript_17099/g.24990  ORF Transcript_17099/g.24990 Transcript_17099/m.24990 type:complete len:198 (+) Transcript_17099:136-729(+)
MGKVKKEKRYRFHSSLGSSPEKKSSLAEKNTHDVSSIANDGPVGEALRPAERLSRGQRKRRERHDRLLKKMNLVNQAKKSSRAGQGLLVGLVDDLEGALPEVLDAAVAAGEVREKRKLGAMRKVVHNRAKKAVAAQEVQHFNLVLNHPAFQKDPIAVIQEHLKNSLPDPKDENETGGNSNVKGSHSKKYPKKVGLKK